MQPAQQQGRRFPSISSVRVRSIRRILVSICLAFSTQHIHSLRASGVISAHAARAADEEIRAFLKSAGILCTTPPAISFVIINVRYHQGVKVALELRLMRTARKLPGDRHLQVLIPARHLIRLNPQDIADHPERVRPCQAAHEVEAGRTGDDDAVDQSVGQLAHVGPERVDLLLAERIPDGLAHIVMQRSGPTAVHGPESAELRVLLGVAVGLVGELLVGIDEDPSHIVVLTETPGSAAKERRGVGIPHSPRDPVLLDDQVDRHRHLLPLSLSRYAEPIGMVAESAMLLYDARGAPA
jgi:hypothetical protein